MIGLILKGMAMGIAEVIPGVSGGSIALITNIYETLLKSINSFGFGLISVFKEDGVKGVMKEINAPFLFKLFLGMGLGVLFGIFVISHLMENNPQLLWGFFFGLILASSILIFKMIKDKSSLSWLLFLLGTVIAYIITIISPQDGSSSLIYVFFCGMMAISALILPGISGSFILLLLGMYTVVITSLKSLITDFSSDKLLLISVFALGCIVGLKAFSKIVTWTYTKYKSNTLAILSGFMLGSLNKIWPWKNIKSILDKTSGRIISQDINSLIETNKENYKILSEQNILPMDHSHPQTFAVIGLFLLAVILIGLYDKYIGTEF